MDSNLPVGMNEHYGRNIDTMPRILEAGETPIWTAKLMEERLNRGERYPHLWKYRDTSDLAIFPLETRDIFYILLTSDNKGGISENGKKGLELIKEGNLTPKHWATVENLEELRGDNLIEMKVRQEDNAYYRGWGLEPEQVSKLDLWRVIARHPDFVPEKYAHNKNLLEEYNYGVRVKTGINRVMRLEMGNVLVSQSNPPIDKTFLAIYSLWTVGKRECNETVGTSPLCCGSVMNYEEGSFIGLDKKLFK